MNIYTNLFCVFRFFNFVVKLFYIHAHFAGREIIRGPTLTFVEELKLSTRSRFIHTHGHSVKINPYEFILRWTRTIMEVMDSAAPSDC